MDTLISVRGLGKQYRRNTDGAQVPVLADLTFAVAPREFVTILGPSGAGKTTLLNILAQIDSATEGEIRIGSEVMPLGDDGALSPGLSCKIGYITQDDNLLPWQTLLDNVLLPLKVQRTLTPTTREHATALMRAAGLEGFEHYYPRELSGGMRKRAALIRSLVYDPPIILMDEPFGALDAETRTILQQDLLTLWEERRKTIVFVTHDISEAIALGDRTLVLTTSPARVKAEFTIPLPRPRDIRGLSGDLAFRDLHRAIRAEVASTCAA
jgi:NitT/TauT family transport system ATP-binding protein